MMRRRLIRGGALAAVFLIPHLVFAAYALYDGGGFWMGFGYPERALIHLVSGSEKHITVSGAPKHFLGDVCLLACDGCPMDCYVPARLRVDCGGGCRLLTGGGDVLASEGSFFAGVLNNGVYLENATFNCYGGACGFDIDVGENMIYSAALSDEVVYGGGYGV
jgi:hypothetical protein